MVQATTAVLVEDMEADTVAVDLAICHCLPQLPLLLDLFQASLALVVQATHTAHQQVLHLPLRPHLSRSLETPPILAMRPLLCPPELEVDSHQASQALVVLDILSALHLALSRQASQAQVALHIHSARLLAELLQLAT